MTYAATEVALTRATKELWAKRESYKEIEPVVFDDQPYVKQDNRPCKRYEPKGRGKRKSVDLESFQSNRIYSLIRSTATQYHY